MSFFNRSFERKRKQELETPLRICEIAQRNGEFEASWRYRDDWLHDRCKKLVKKGFLKRAGRTKRGNLFKPTKLTPLADLFL